MDQMSEDFPRESIAALEDLSRGYMAETDPVRQSGFSGGDARWRAEREPILDAISEDGSLLDIGCANGYLLECLGIWGRERGVTLDLHGLEYSADLADLARTRIGKQATIHVGNAWDWKPPKRYRYVYSMDDIVPVKWLSTYLRRLVADFASPGGRVILGSYGSRSRGERAYDVAKALEDAGLIVAGTAWGGDPPLTHFAWTDAI